MNDNHVSTSKFHVARKYKIKTLWDLTNLRRPDTGLQMTGFEVMDALCELATREQARYWSEARSRKQPQVGFGSKLFCTIEGLFVIAAGDLPDGVITNLFDAETIEQLKMMRNEYEFWITVEQVVGFQQMVAIKLPISIRAVNQDYQRMLKTIVSSMGPVHRPLCSWVGEGGILPSELSNYLRDCC